LRISSDLYWIEAPGPGRLAVAPRPRGGDWLEDEVAAWVATGIDVVASLLTPAESVELSLENEPRLAAAAGIEFLSCPIPDREAPDSDRAAQVLVARLASAVETGRTVLIHCRQGIGRAGMIAAASLGALGVPLGEALERISTARGLPIPETAAQLAWLKRMAEVAASPY
jgi:protein-tyrosine phosphatase